MLATTNTKKAKAIRYATIEAIANYINHFHNLTEFDQEWFWGLKPSTMRNYENLVERLMCEFTGTAMKNGHIPEYIKIHDYFTREEIQLIFDAVDYHNAAYLRVENNEITCNVPDFLR